MKVAYLGIGLPGSGKTTVLEQFAAEIGAAFVCIDKLREDFNGDASNMSNNEQMWKTLVYPAITQALAVGSVVVDATNALLTDRVYMIAFCRAKGATEVYGKYFATAPEICWARNLARERVVPEDPFNARRKALEQDPPSKDDGFDKFEVIDLSEL